MKCKLECRIIPVDVLGRVKSNNDAFSAILYFSSVEDAEKFVLRNEDRILSGVKVSVIETEQP